MINHLWQKIIILGFLLTLFGYSAIPRVSLAQSSEAIVADWSVTDDFDQIPSSLGSQIQNLRILYAHTSHGEHPIIGLNTLGISHAQITELSGDLGHNGDTRWTGTIRTHLGSPSNPNYDVVMWAWCSGVSDNSAAGIQAYLNAFSNLEAEYPTVTFVYWTGPLDGAGPTGNTHVLNEQIRSFVRQNGKVLYDFEDIERYDPAGTDYLSRNPGRSGNGCRYDGGNWCEDWCQNHACSTAYQCPHNYQGTTYGGYINCNQKGKAFYWLLARLAGWNQGGTLPSPSPTYQPSPYPSPSAPIGGSPTPPPEAPDCRADVNSDGKIDSLDLIQVLAHWEGSSSYTQLLRVLANWGASCQAQSANRPWGGFYTPHEEIGRYGMTGVISNPLNSAAEIMNYVRRAQGNYSVIVTVGNVAESQHPVDGTQEAWQRAYDYFHAILRFTPAEKEELYRLIADGTIQAFRFYDEVMNASTGGTSMNLNYCDVNQNYQVVSSTRTATVMPPGRDGAPGFGDLLFALANDLPENAVVGSTSGPSYMVLVANRIDELRAKQAATFSPLSAKSVLAYRGAPSRIRGGGYPQLYEDFFACTLTHESDNRIYYLGNKSAEYGTDNYDFFADFMAMCHVSGLDFVASWDWTRGTAGSFSSRMVDLADGGVTKNGQVITLSDLQNACGPR